MRTERILPLLVLAVAQFNLSGASAQTAQGARIVEKIDESQLITLKGNTPPVANADTDLGEVRPDLAMTDLVLVLSRSLEQQAAFDAFVESQYDASSPNFHHWLTSAEVGEKFGPSLTDLATVSSWLTGHGLVVAEVSNDRMAIRFGGTVAQVESALHTEIHNLQVNGQRHIANMSDPEIPAALAPVIAGVKALHDFHPRPLHRLGSKVQFNSTTGEWQRVTEPALPGVASLSGTATDSPHPEFGITVGSGTSSSLVEDVSPYDFATIYNVLPLWNAGTPIDGTGQTIAIAATSDVNTADIASYRSVFGLPAGPALKTIVANGVDPGQCTAKSGNCTIDDLYENTLDVEVSGAVARNAQIDLVVSGPTSPTTDQVYSSADYVIQNNTAKILSLSYGLCELFMGTSGNTAYNNLWQTAATEGIAVFVATGDAGAPTCDQGLATGTPYQASYGLSVNGLASTPYDTAVGGTDLNWGTTASPDWNATNSSNGASAANYVPEVPWNDSCTNPLALSYFQAWATQLTKAGFQNVTSPTDAESACQFATTWYKTIAQNTNPSVDISFFVNSVGGGGGASHCTVNSTTSTTTNPDPTSCSGGYAKPSWQAGVAGIASDGVRDLPDVSFFAGNGLLGSATLVCVSESGTCVSSTTLTTEPTAQEVGGTSVAAPEMAGVMALINQKAGAAQGNPDAELYALAAKQTYSSCSAESVKTSASCYFNDPDTGTIAMPCKPSSPGCTVSHAGDTVGVDSGFSAAAAYDQATGLGSLNVANVVNSWTSILGTAKATIALSPSANNISVSQSLTVTVNVSGDGTHGTPTGSVSLAGGGYVAAAGALSNGAFTFNIPAYTLDGGTDSLLISYGGDVNYAETSATTSVTVTKLVSNTSATPASASVNTGQSLNVSVTVSGSGPAPTGSVTLGGGGYSSAPQALAGGSATIAIPANKLSAGSDTLTVTYNGDSFYNTSSGTATVNVTQSSFSLSATAPTAISRGGSAASTVTVSSNSSYSGTVTLTCAKASGPTNQSGDDPTCSIPGTAMNVGGTATATVTTVAATTGALVQPGFGGQNRGLAAGATALALIFLCGIPPRRRNWRSILGVVVLLVALGSVAACGGGGGGGSNGGGNRNPGTASGAYTFTVTATGNPAVTPAPTATFTVTVN